MLTQRLFLIPMVLLMVAALSISQTVNASQTDRKAELTAIYAKLDQALKDKDYKVVQSYEAANFKAKQKDGKEMSREEYDSYGSQLFAAAQNIKTASTKIESIENGKNENEVIAVVTQSLDLAVAGPDGKTHQFVASAKSRDTWLHDKDGWHIVYSEELETKATMDGQPLG